MARLAQPKSSERLHYFRSRLRKASCMNDDDASEDLSDDDMPPPHPSSALAPPPIQEDEITFAPSSQQVVDMDEQLQCTFFTRLPPEIRRMIYIEVWRVSNDTLKLHIHAATDGSRLTHTPCKCSSVESSLDEEDPMQMDSWPGWRGKNQPPRWFWHAWGLRLRWGAHWRCQADAMMAWKTKEDGTCVDERDLRRGNYLDVFLTCKKMYSEAVESFFESTTLIFTASEDAYRFFLQQPHPYQPKIHAVDFSFTHFKDHLFLQPIASKHPRLAVGSNVPVSQEVWTPLMLCIRETLPELGWLRVHLSTTAPAARVEVFLDELRTWEQEGHGKIEEKSDGLIYVEEGRQQAALGTCADHEP
ncbi:hypothetical protein VP1G_02400 [Cytospora mali]|uniref:DUF7730 domain-containing protein n=1 Tax=Cytospora mali TaxID=578113 RepID=A0A194UTT3_CYTMA|nr:hypothetical protein VP1G_02400 [Valsa mali var. pyri (nom. inval.)]